MPRPSATVASGQAFSSVLCIHKEDTRPALTAFVETLKKVYREAVAFPM